MNVINYMNFKKKRTMKKNILYALVACLAFSFAACSDDPMDATEKHVYGPNENPFLEIDQNATISISQEFPVQRIEEVQEIKLADYAEKFQSQLGMTVDETISALSTGKVVFYPINVARGQWLRTSAPTKGTNGWHFNSAGGVCEASASSFSVELDVNKKAILISCNSDIALGGYSFNVGFAIDNGTEYGDYVRFSDNFTVTDPSKIVVSVKMAAADWAGNAIKFADYKDAIEVCTDMTLDEFNEAVNAGVDGPMELILVDKNGNWDPNFEAADAYYTANGLGYWLTSESIPVVWEGNDMTYYIETGNGQLNFGRASGSAYNGKTIPLRFVYTVKADHTRYIEFIVSVVME